MSGPKSFDVVFLLQINSETQGALKMDFRVLFAVQVSRESIFSPRSNVESPLQPTEVLVTGFSV